MILILDVGCLFFIFLSEKKKLKTLTNRGLPHISGIRKQCKHQKNNAAYFGVESIVAYTPSVF